MDAAALNAFLKRAFPLTTDVRLLKLGRRIATADVHLYTEGPDKPCAHAVVAYALPAQ
jgi:acyl-coenzyme A thioesterase PaaI-like protein